MIGIGKESNYSRKEDSQITGGTSSGSSSSERKMAFSFEMLQLQDIPHGFGDMDDVEFLRNLEGVEQLYSTFKKKFLSGCRRAYRKARQEAQRTAQVFRPEDVVYPPYDIVISGFSGAGKGTMVAYLLNAFRQDSELRSLEKEIEAPVTVLYNPYVYAIYSDYFKKRIEHTVGELTHEEYEQASFDHWRALEEVSTHIHGPKIRVSETSAPTVVPPKYPWQKTSAKSKWYGGNNRGLFVPFYLARFADTVKGKIAKSRSLVDGRKNVEYQSLPGQRSRTFVIFLRRASDLGEHVKEVRTQLLESTDLGRTENILTAAAIQIHNEKVPLPTEKFGEDVDFEKLCLANLVLAVASKKAIERSDQEFIDLIPQLRKNDNVPKFHSGVTFGSSPKDWQDKYEDYEEPFFKIWEERLKLPEGHVLITRNSLQAFSDKEKIRYDQQLLLEHNIFFDLYKNLAQAILGFYDKHIQEQTKKNRAEQIAKEPQLKEGKGLDKRATTELTFQDQERKEGVEQQDGKSTP